MNEETQLNILVSAFSNLVDLGTGVIVKYNNKTYVILNQLVKNFQRISIVDSNEFKLDNEVDIECYDDGDILTFEDDFKKHLN